MHDGQCAQKHLSGGFQVIATAIHDGARRQDRKANGLHVTTILGGNSDCLHATGVLHPFAHWSGRSSGGRWCRTNAQQPQGWLQLALLMMKQGACSGLMGRHAGIQKAVKLRVSRKSR
jgi:hypothetical protein